MNGGSATVSSLPGSTEFDVYEVTVARPGRYEIASPDGSPLGASFVFLGPAVAIAYAPF